jgi:hypothetical protein
MVTERPNHSLNLNLKTRVTMSSSGLAFRKSVARPRSTTSFVFISREKSPFLFQNSP